MRDWFVVNTGYVRQLATSFYNELTVRENLLFSMYMQARKGESLGDKLKRVEQVIREMGLQEQADVVVGDGIGLGLSGGQVRENLSDRPSFFVCLCVSPLISKLVDWYLQLPNAIKENRC